MATGSTTCFWRPREEDVPSMVRRGSSMEGRKFDRARCMTCGATRFDRPALSGSSRTIGQVTWPMWAMSTGTGWQTQASSHRASSINRPERMWSSATGACRRRSAFPPWREVSVCSGPKEATSPRDPPLNGCRRRRWRRPNGPRDRRGRCLRQNPRPGGFRPWLRTRRLRARPHRRGIDDQFDGRRSTPAAPLPRRTRTWLRRRGRRGRFRRSPDHQCGVPVEVPVSGRSRSPPPFDTAGTDPTADNLDCTSP